MALIAWVTVTETLTQQPANILLPQIDPSLAFWSLMMDDPVITARRVPCSSYKKPVLRQLAKDYRLNGFGRPSSPKPPFKVGHSWFLLHTSAELLSGQMETINHASGKLDFDDVDPDLGMHLLSLHWNRQHHSFLITYRPAFMRDMACNGPYFSKLLLNAIYFGASKFSPRLEVRKDPDDVRTAGWKYRERVRDLLGRCLDKSEITTIQALLVMANSLFALGSERSAAWIYSGLAFRMITDLGMHSEASTSNDVLGLTDEDVEIRRRVFWGAFGMLTNGPPNVHVADAHSRRQDSESLSRSTAIHTEGRCRCPYRIPGSLRGERTVEAFRIYSRYSG